MSIGNADDYRRIFGGEVVPVSAYTRDRANLAAVRMRLQLLVDHGDRFGWQTARTELEGILASDYWEEKK
jgi:hypothetical protein